MFIARSARSTGLKGALQQPASRPPRRWLSQRIHRLLQPESTADGSNVTVSGFIRTLRKQKKIAFVALGDGSTLQPLQVVLQPEQCQGYDDLSVLPLSDRVMLTSFDFPLQTFDRSSGVYNRNVATLSCRCEAITRATRERCTGVGVQ